MHTGRVGPPLPHIVETELGDEISVYNGVHESALVLNTTAADVWRLCDGQHTIPDIVALISRAYGQDPSLIRDDVVRTIRSFADQHYLPPID